MNPLDVLGLAVSPIGWYRMESYLFTATRCHAVVECPYGCGWQAFGEVARLESRKAKHECGAGK